MNAKNSHCMNRLGRILLALAMMVFAMAPLAAQVTEGSGNVLYDKYENALRTNFWNDGSNPVGIRQDSSIARAAQAELYGNVSAGGFRQSYEAAVPWSVGAKASSFVHLAKFSMKGSFSFEQMQGENMCGSMFVNPGYYPIDALEFTPGRKIKQTYAFDGAISVDVADQWRVGLGMDFTSANLSKRKDVRHSNYLLDMTVTPGVIWHGEKWAVGLNTILRKTTDTPTAKQIGTKDTYKAFLDKGLYYGKYEDWEGSGLHLSESGVSGLPVKEIFSGAGIQIQHGSAFLDINYQKGVGTIGEKQYIWFRFPSRNLLLNYGDRWQGRRFAQSVRVAVDWHLLTNNETVIEKVTEGGVTTTVEHGSNQILSRQITNLLVEYALQDDVQEFVLKSGVKETLSEASQMYPYVVDRNLSQWMVAMGYTRHIASVDVGGALGYRAGFVKENERVVNGDSGVTSELLRLDSYNKMDIDYQTAHRINLGAYVTYNFQKGIYVKAMVDYTGAISVSALPGADRVTATLKFGYNF